MVTTATTARNIQLIVETITTSHKGLAYHVDHQKSRRVTTVSVYWSVIMINVVCVQSVIHECTAYNALVAENSEISASVQNPRYFRSQVIQNY